MRVVAAVGRLFEAGFPVVHLDVAHVGAGDHELVIGWHDQAAED